MLNRHYIFWICCCLLLCGFTVKASDHLPVKRFTLTVKVTDSLDHKPLEAASVTIPELKKNGITGADGIFRIDSITPGSYTIQVVFIGYHSYQEKIWVNENKTLVITLCPATFHLHETIIYSHSDELQSFGLQTRLQLNARQIEQTRGLTFSDQLKQLPGVTTLSTGPAVTKPVIRGLHSNRLVTVNGGVRQEGQQWGADHGAEIDPFSPAKIEVIKGASSVEYGAEAIGGVVKVSPKEFRDVKGIGGELQMMGASNNGMGAGSLLLEGSHFDKHRLSWRVQGTMRKAGDSRTPDYVMSNSGFYETDGSYALHYAYKNFHMEWMQSYYSTTLGILRTSHIGNTTDLLHAIETGTPLYTAPFTYHIDRPKQEVSHTVSSFKTFYVWKTGARLQLMLSRQLNERKEFDRPPLWNTALKYTEVPAYYLTLTTDQAELKFEHARWKNIKGQWGVSWMNQGNYTEGLQPIIPNFRAYTTGAYVIEKWNKGRWMLEAGVRADQRSQTRFRRVNNEVVSDGKTFSNVTFSTGAMYHLSERVHLQANVSSAWRPPSINELYSYGLHGGTATFEIGNDSLKSERSYNAELSLSYDHQQWKGEVSVYRNAISNFIYKEPLPYPTITIRGAFPQFRFVQDDVLLQGVDARITRYFGKHYSAGINASYLYAQNTSKNQPLIFMPSNRARLTLGYEGGNWKKFHEVFINVQHAYVSKQDRFPAGIDYVDPPPAYQLTDVNMGFEISLGRQVLRWSVSVQNVFNVSYRDYLSRLRYYSLEPGRNFMIRLAIPFHIIQQQTSHEKHN